MTAKERLKYYVTNILNMSIREFERECGLKANYLNSANKTLNSDAIEQVLKKYPNIDINWLFTGHSKNHAEQELLGAVVRLNQAIQTLTDQIEILKSK